MTMLSVEFKTMGCQARAVLDATGARAQAALHELPAWFEARERVLSRFDPESALSKLNDRGTAEPVDDVLWEAIDVALRAAASTNGLVTPTILRALEGAGYDRSFDALDRDQVASLPPERAVPSWQTVEREERTRSIRLPPGLSLDLGGTAKGWCADAAVLHLAPVGPALVDLGGDISVSHSWRGPWPIAVEDSRAARGVLELVLLREGGIATSGRDFRRWRRSGRDQHHVIDPATGVPSRTDVWTATVIAPSALAAEIAAKRLLLEGSRQGLAWIESKPEFAALVVTEAGIILASSRFRQFAWQEVA
jgi:thiamine biosynthesis lipoprotein